LFPLIAYRLSLIAYRLSLIAYRLSLIAYRSELKVASSFLVIITSLEDYVSPFESVHQIGEGLVRSRYVMKATADYFTVHYRTMIHFLYQLPYYL